jgi:hypothetical protein
MGGKRAKYWEKDMHECRMLVENPEGKSTLRKFIRRWEYNINMYLKVVVGEDVEWLFLAQYRNNWLALQDAMTNILVPQNAGTFLTS